MKTETVKFTIDDLNREQLWQFAQLLKRIDYHTVLGLTDGSCDVPQCDAMLTAIASFQLALGQAGYFPR